ncbi:MULTISPECIES: VOC family protein [Rhodococcus]|jgi:uncharacterized glyoxalase superfamily protein PhnB|uniref:VOC family protein n=1 Tax=Rhodococcus aetherivorans TaxID=191292 RepID=A0AA46SC87_9NOCA|nr:MULTISPECIES: VOC family protein [Rhodococcus]NCL74778.1 hypothetical protein [Rhodococcus sp. YH1]AKE89296.1 glyoxalase [Rhodococcus aetherivorans]ANZ25996.1 glyoxalase [Rhodococcus sp. WB1]MBC2590919.1 VOC family protein [Rhodococcus aetherivorans]QIX49743.1 glyoxalase [Rhodococcus sp. DMU1]
MTTTALTTTVWPCLSYTDARAAIRFLVDAFGFTENAVYGDGDRVDHAELRWPHGGGVMLGSAGRGGPIETPAGTGCIYLVAPDATAVDTLHERAVAAGATIVVALHDTDYGSHDFTCRDPQGVYWSFGTYPGA